MRTGWWWPRGRCDARTRGRHFQFRFEYGGRAKATGVGLEPGGGEQRGSSNVCLRRTIISIWSHGGGSLSVFPSLIICLRYLSSGCTIFKRTEVEGASQVFKFPIFRIRRLRCQDKGAHRPYLRYSVSLAVMAIASSSAAERCSLFLLARMI